MEGIRGTSGFMIDAATLARRIAAYQEILIDIGTGDGRYVKHVARTSPACFAIGIDACRENVCRTSRTAPDNALYLIANALALPHELHRLAARVTINFPWGSLLEGLLNGDAALLDGIGAIARPGATLEVRLNAGALDEAGWSLEAGGEQVRRMLRDSGFVVTPPQTLEVQALRACPTTWAQRLAFGRDPRALYLRARCLAQLQIADSPKGYPIADCTF